MKYQSKNNSEYEKIIITKNTKKSSVERNALMINAENIIQKNKKYNDYHKNQNIMLRKKNIINILTHKI